MDLRYTDLKEWLLEILPEFSGFDSRNWQLETVSGDASFRRYFRAISGENTWIAVDAPPEKEDSRPFIEVATALERTGVPVPHIHNHDLSKGFMLLGDFGDDLYLDQLSNESVDGLYNEALKTLLLMQSCQPARGKELPLYDEALLRREVELFREWFVEKLLGVKSNDEAQRLVSFLFDYLIDSALEQPKVFVHRDYHSRNIMYRKDLAPGIIDFQDAVEGPVTYDLVSLLRDCYIDWPDEKVYGWVEGYRQDLIANGQNMPDSVYFKRWFDLMGAQRHLKAIGIFARLHIRDGKSGYLADIPRTLNYLIAVAAKVEELKPVAGWMVSELLPAMRNSEYFSDTVLDNWIVS